MNANEPLAAIPITAHAVTLNVLAYLIDQADKGDGSALLASLQPEELDVLRNLPVRELFRLTDQKQPLIHIALDPRQLRLCLARVRERDDGQADRMWFIRRGTPHVLMEELFGTPIREFRELRRVAGMNVRPGRPKVLKAAHAARVRSLWHQLGHRVPLPQRYRRIGEAFPDDSIGSLYGAIHDRHD